MVIDMHTHVFPDAIAGKTIAFLAEKCKVAPGFDGTAAGLAAQMKRTGVDLSLILPVVTRPAQYESINRYAVLLDRTPGFRSFGGIHPADPDIDTHVAQIAADGLCGIKLHPVYQDTPADDERYVEIVTQAAQRGLYSVFHAGVDDGFPDSTLSDVSRMEHLLTQVEQQVGDSKLIFAHLGGNRQFDQVERLLVGRKVYLDLAYIIRRIAPEQLLRIIRAHGADRILFATDAPWSDPAADLVHLRQLGLTAEEEEAILWKNAASILGIGGVS